MNTYNRSFRHHLPSHAGVGSRRMTGPAKRTSFRPATTGTGTNRIPRTSTINDDFLADKDPGFPSPRRLFEDSSLPLARLNHADAQTFCLRLEMRACRVAIRVPVTGEVSQAHGSRPTAGDTAATRSSQSAQASRSSCGRLCPTTWPLRRTRCRLESI